METIVVPIGEFIEHNWKCQLEPAWETCTICGSVTGPGLGGFHIFNCKPRINLNELKKYVEFTNLSFDLIDKKLVYRRFSSESWIQVYCGETSKISKYKQKQWKIHKLPDSKYCAILF